MRKIFIIILMAFALISCKPEKIGIYKVTVLDSISKQINVIDQPDMINKLNELWKGFEPIDELPNTEWTNKLDIDSEKMSGRWLYNQEGFLAKLNKQLKPSFKVIKKETFNKIILGRAGR